MSRYFVANLAAGDWVLLGSNGGRQERRNQKKTETSGLQSELISWDLR